MPAIRSRVMLAFSISLVAHGLIVLAWLNVRTEGAMVFAAIRTDVNSLDDREMVVNIREPRLQQKSLPIVPHVDANPPAILPSTMVKGPAVGPVIQVGGNPIPYKPTAKAPSGIPLHGKSKFKSIVYVLDRSSSMGADGLLRKACASIKASLGQLNTECRFQIIAYNGGAERFDSRLLLTTADNRERAERWLDTLVAEGSSNHRTGMLEAIALHPDAVFLLTDADDLDEKEVRAIRLLIREPVSLTAAVFGGTRPKRETPLERLTREMGGEVKYVGR